MAYAPTVNDRSGEILAQAKMQDQALHFADQQQMWQGIGEGLNSIGEGLGQMIQKKQEDAAKATSIGEALNTMQSILPTYGPEGAALQEIVNQRLSAAGSNLDKMSGVFMAVKPAMENLQSRYNQQANIENYKGLYDYKASLGGPDTPASPRMNSENIRSMVAEAKQAGFTDDQIKTKLQAKYGDWAVRSVYPPQNQGIWMGQ